MNKSSYEQLMKFLADTIYHVQQNEYRRVDDAGPDYYVSVYRVGDYVRIDIHEISTETKKDVAADHAVDYIVYSKPDYSNPLF